MEIELRELSVDDGTDIFEMIKEIGPGENGFGNKGYDMEYADFPEFLEKQINNAKGLNASPQYVPQTMFWLIINGRPVGIAKLRHYLNDKLIKEGGHIGYSIRPSERGRGYGNIILKEALVKAEEKGIIEVLITCDKNNPASAKTIIANGGVFENEVQEDGSITQRYWINL